MTADGAPSEGGRFPWKRSKPSKAAHWFAGVAALAAVIIAGLFLHQPDERQTHAEQSTTLNSSTPRVCAGRTARCHLLSTGIWAVVYAPIRGVEESHASSGPMPEERDGLVFWDPGGPGLIPLDAGLTRSQLPSWLKNATVAMFVEPWAVHEVSSACLGSLASVSAGGELSDQQVEEWPAQFKDACDVDLYRLDGAEYEKSFKELSKKEGKISGVYAQSFGAVRASAVMPELKRTDGWAIMDAPAPPPGTHATTLMVERSLALEEGLQDIMGCTHSGASVDCRKELHRTLREMGSDTTTPTGLAGGVEEYERMTALLSLSTNMASNKKPLREILTNWPKLSAADQEVIKSGSHAFTRRHGDSQVLPDFVGYMANLCPAYTGWGAGAGSPERNPLGAALSRMHYACSVMPSDEDSAWTLTEAEDAPRLLLLENSHDPVTPPSTARAWGDKYPDADHVEYEYLGHTKAPEKLSEEISAWLAGVSTERTDRS
ncbi:alpha/beta hydrolase [Streptomyces sp. SM11]|uniref:alpha/beta hydrolase n=1 Tax=Streptomyces sp. SM11 TaxID=565557 RepID=UPI0011B0B55E|nr:alpha/beta hydrolase [Streptomyces sp. SM11]